MPVERKDSIEWDGNVLSGWLSIDGVPIKVTADRETIHQHAAGFSDALSWEISRHREEIFERLAPYLKATCKRSETTAEKARKIP